MLLQHVRPIPDRAQEGERRFTAEHSGRLQRLLGSIRQPVNARQQHLLDRVRYGQRRLEVALLPDRARELLEKEWVAFGLVEDAASQRIRDRLAPEHRADDSHAVLFG